jgi:predicted HTH transcriptional regulator
MERSQLIELLENPQESLGVEMKGWLNPEDPAQAATIVRALIALRNFDGGILILGLDDKSLKPLKTERPVHWSELYHADKIQALVASLRDHHSK